MRTALSTADRRGAVRVHRAETNHDLGATMTAHASPVTGVDFATVLVRDFPTAKEFYGTTLGLPCSAEYERVPGGEFETGNLTLQVLDAAAVGQEFKPSTHPLALHVDDVAAARSALEGRGVSFLGETMDSGVCHMAVFADPDGNVLLLHHRYAPRDAA
jgi:predicted enzyme related to lactoylglutathione lyase